MFVRELYSPITTLLRIYLIARAVKALVLFNFNNPIRPPKFKQKSQPQITFCFLSHIDLGGLLLYNKDVLSKYSVFIVD